MIVDGALEASDFGVKRRGFDTRPHAHALQRAADAPTALPIPLSHIHELFNVVDVDGNGNVSYSEFCEQLKAFDMDWAKTEERIRAKKIDSRGSARGA